MKVWSLQGVNCGGGKEWSKISVQQCPKLPKYSLTPLLRGVSPTRVDQRAAFHWTLTSAQVSTSPWGCGFLTFYSGDGLPSIQSISGETARTRGNFTLPGVISRSRNRRYNSVGLKQAGERFCKSEWTRTERGQLLHNSDHQILGLKSSQINLLKAESP